MARHKNDSAREARWARKQEKRKYGPKKPKKAKQNAPVVSNTIGIESQPGLVFTHVHVSQYMQWALDNHIIDILKRNIDPEAYSQEKLDFEGSTEYAKYSDFTVVKTYV